MASMHRPFRLLIGLLFILPLLAPRSVDGSPSRSIMYVDEDATANNDSSPWIQAYTKSQNTLGVAQRGHQTWGFHDFHYLAPESSDPTADQYDVTTNTERQYNARADIHADPVPYPPALAEIVNPQHRVSNTVSWSYDGSPEVPAPTSYTLEEATEPAYMAPTTYSTTATQLTVEDPAREKVGGTYYYRVRGHNQYGPSPWSTVRSTTLGVVPYAPTLHNIANPDGDDSYTVAWSYEYDYPAVNTFILQEATNPGFSGAVSFPVDGNTTSYDFTDKGNQTYYYRVKGRNAYGDGPWSAIKSVVSVAADFYDDFTDPSSGWLTHQAKSGLVGCDDGLLQENPAYKYNLFYEDGRYNVNVPLDCRAGGQHGDTRHIHPINLAPGVARPANKTCLQVRGAFEMWDPDWSFYGLVFAASDDKATAYSLEVNNLGDWAVLKRSDYDFPGPNHPWEDQIRHNLVDWADTVRWPARPAFEANTLRAEMEGNNVKLFINGRLVHSFTDSQITSFTRVGIIGGAWEITPTQTGYDYFYLDEGCDSF